MNFCKWLIVFFCLNTALPVTAASPEERGLEIIKEQEKRDRGWRDSQATLKMILRNKNGQETVRDLRILAFEMHGDGDKTLTIFDKPKDVKGTALLTYSHGLEPDEQWLFLPALKRVKRIASKNKSGPFIGSEFAFEDLTSFEVEKYTYKYLRDEPCPTDKKLSCFVVESYPVDENSGYSRQIAWIDDAEYRTQFVEFYDRKQSLLKTLTATDFKIYKRKYWRPHASLMENQQSGKSTLLQLEEIEFKTGLKEKDFSQNSLKRTN
jgi:hypothetical protein